MTSALAKTPCWRLQNERLKILKRNAEYKRLHEICRNHWNEFDPIGVRVNLSSDSEPDWFPDDEYDSYVPQTVKLAVEGADAVKMRKHIEHCCTVNMSLNSTRTASKAINEFVEKLLELQNP